MPDQLNALESELTKLYSSFDAYGWWIYQDLDVEAMILESSSPGAQDFIRSVVTRHSSKLRKSGVIVDQEWQTMITPGYRPHSASQKLVAGRTKLNALAQERTALSRQIATVFSDAKD